MDYTAFSHGQIQSKIWLCEHLEPHIPKDSNVAILGSWYNTLGTILLTRQPTHYHSIIGIDIDSSAVDVADKVCEAWQIQPNCKIQNFCADVNTYNLLGRNVVINTSVENIDKTNWFENIESNALVCLQTVNVTNEQVKKDWKILTYFNDLNNFISSFKFTSLLYTGEKEFVYTNLSYKRLMIIGIK